MHLADGAILDLKNLGKLLHDCNQSFQACPLYIPCFSYIFSVIVLYLFHTLGLNHWVKLLSTPKHFPDKCLLFLLQTKDLIVKSS